MYSLPEEVLTFISGDELLDRPPPLLHPASVGGLNDALESAAEEFAGLLVNGDRWEPGGLENAVATLSSLPQAAGLLLNHRIVRGGGDGGLGNSWRRARRAGAEALLTGRFRFVSSCLLFSRAEALAAGGFDPKLPNIFGFALAVRLAGRAPLPALPRPLVMAAWRKPPHRDALLEFGALLDSLEPGDRLLKSANVLAGVELLASGRVNAGLGCLRRAAALGFAPEARALSWLLSQGIVGPVEMVCRWRRALRRPLSFC